jgi:uncharacterized protein
VGQRFPHERSAFLAVVVSDSRYRVGVIRRHLTRLANESLSMFRVTIINGPRQSGKTTLVRELVASGGSYWSLDDDVTRTTAAADPHGFVELAASPMAIDEVQRGGDAVVLAVKSLVDRRTARGQFILAGSTRFLTVPKLSESLAGRAEVLDLWPLSQGEIVGVEETFLDDLLLAPERLAARRREALDRRSLFVRLVRGGFPELADLPADQTSRWHRSYVRTVVERDIRETSAISQAQELPRLLRLVAANSAGEMVHARMAADLRLSDDTVRRYLSLLEMVGLVVSIPAWTPSLTTREKRHPKMVIADSGLMCSLVGRDAESLASPSNPFIGPALESFVAMELVKQRGWSKRQPTLRHWRDRNGPEVDLVVEADDGTVGAIEVKASSGVAVGDAKHLMRLRDAVGDRFAAGVVLYLGDRMVPLGDRLWALPVTTLWGD